MGVAAMQDVHIPVLLDEVIELMEPRTGEIYVDGNLGLGGHAAAMLDSSAPGGRVIGFDWDVNALVKARQNLATYGDRVEYVHDNFATVKESLLNLKLEQVDGILLDLGLSSLQLDESGRGFSFQGDEPLDMRMDERVGETAADLVNTLREEELADIFYYFGEERQARRIAAFIVDRRRKNPITTTKQLVEIVARAVPRKFQPKKIHVATKVFQALRIAVNREMENLTKILEDGVEVLKPGGRFCVISFHSLEDRLVKRSFLENRKLRIITKKPVRPGEKECRVNPRARSAKLRVAQVEEGK